MLITANSMKDTGAVQKGFNMLLPALRGAHTHRELFRQLISIPGSSHMTFYQIAWWDEQFQLYGVYVYIICSMSML